jgi:hypothetical protein
LKINERTEKHLKRIIREDPFASYKEINMESANLGEGAHQLDQRLMEGIITSFLIFQELKKLVSLL